MQMYPKIYTYIRRVVLFYAGVVLHVKAPLADPQNDNLSQLQEGPNPSPNPYKVNPFACRTPGDTHFPELLLQRKLTCLLRIATHIFSFRVLIYGTSRRCDDANIAKLNVRIWKVPIFKNVNTCVRCWISDRWWWWDPQIWHSVKRSRCRIMAPLHYLMHRTSLFMNDEP